MRDFQKILERGGDSYPIGWYLKLQAEYLLMKWARVRDGTLDYFEFLAEFPAIQTQIRHWLTTGIDRILFADRRDVSSPAGC